MQLTNKSFVHLTPGAGHTHAQPSNDYDEQAPLSRGSTLSNRIIQESLTNVARHSQSSEARVELATDCRFLRILIEDRGVGFDPSEVTGNGFGLEVLRARAVALGGCLTIDSASGQGTRVVAEIPLRENLW